jgi:hypothetical protein
MESNLNEQKTIKRLKQISDISSPYIPTPDKNLTKCAKQMLKELEEFEKIKEYTNYQIHYLLAIAYRNYSAWFIRGDQRKKYLDLMVDHLDKSILINSDQVEVKVELARILIEEKLIRNLEKALIIISDLEKTKSLPDWMSSIVEKAKRWSGQIEIPEDNNFSKIDPSPASLREERTKLRKLLTDFLKENSIEKARIIGTRLYNLALLVAYLYKGHDCNSGVMGIEYDQAAEKIKLVGEKFNFNYFGKIEDAEFLSETDYKKLIRIFGDVQSKISVNKVKDLI